MHFKVSFDKWKLKWMQFESFKWKSGKASVRQGKTYCHLSRSVQIIIEASGATLTIRSFYQNRMHLLKTVEMTPMRIHTVYDYKMDAKNCHIYIFTALLQCFILIWNSLFIIINAELSSIPPLHSVHEPISLTLCIHLVIYGILVECVCSVQQTVSSELKFMWKWIREGAFAFAFKFGFKIRDGKKTEPNTLHIRNELHVIQIREKIRFHTNFAEMRKCWKSGWNLSVGILTNC